MSETKKSLFNLTQEDLDWINKCRSCRDYGSSFKTEITDDHDIKFVYEYMNDYHECDYGEDVLLITLPDVIRDAFHRIEDHATREVQRNMRKLLGL